MMFIRAIALLGLLMIGLIAGFFYAWVCSTMWGLDTTDPVTAVKAMNAMNISVRNGLFFPVFFLTPIVLALGAIAMWLKGFRASAIAFAGATLMYGFGGILPTALFNVPMNRALELVSLDGSVETVQSIWTAYSSEWQWWNQARTIASFLAFLLAGWGVMRLPSMA